MSELKWTSKFIATEIEVTQSKFHPFVVGNYLAAMTEIKRLQEANRWIPVSERLPEEYISVHVLWHWKDALKELYPAIAQRWRYETELLVHGQPEKIVAYWMPFPVPSLPKEDEE